MRDGVMDRVPIGRSGIAAAWGSGLSVVRGRGAGRGWMNSDGISWDWPAIVAGFSAYARKGIAMSRLRNRMIQDRKLAGLVEGTPNDMPISKERNGLELAEYSNDIHKVKPRKDLRKIEYCGCDQTSARAPRASLAASTVEAIAGTAPRRPAGDKRLEARSRSYQPNAPDWRRTSSLARWAGVCGYRWLCIDAIARNRPRLG